MARIVNDEHFKEFVTLIKSEICRVKDIIDEMDASSLVDLNDREAMIEELERLRRICEELNIDGE